MSVEIKSGVVELDKVAQAWLAALREARGQLDVWGEKFDIARANLEAALGAAETGLVNGQEVLKWSWSKPVKRFDAVKAREILPAELLAILDVEGKPVRSFRVVRDGE